MFKLPDFPTVDFPSIDLSGLDIRALRNIDLSKYVPAVKFPTVDLPAVDLPSIDVAKLGDAVRDMAYLTVGIGAAAVEQAQARRRELANTISNGLEATKIQVDTVVDRSRRSCPRRPPRCSVRPARSARPLAARFSG